MYYGYKMMWAATHEKSTETKHIQIQCVCSNHGSVDGCFLPSLPRHLPMWLDSDLLLTLVPCERSPFWWWLNTGHNPGCALTLTSPEKTSLTKVLSLLYCIYSRVNKRTHLQPNETGAVVGQQGHSTRPPVSCTDHTPPAHPILRLPWDGDTARGVTVHRTEARDPGPCPGSAGHVCDRS